MTDILIQAMLNPALYDHPVRGLELIETHISWVILTGPYAYKIKKPVDLHFLDFSSLDKRHHYCLQELRLNKRLAPKLYLAVIKITGVPEHPQLNGAGEAIDYAVKMVQFPQQAQLDRMLMAGVLTHTHIEAVARKVAAFHDGLASVEVNSRFGETGRVLAPVQDNFAQIEERSCSADAAVLQRLRSWIERSFESLTPLLKQRKSAGYIRECHGDMHLRNIAWYDNEVMIFDCIEFNDDLRCIDVVSEIAFMVMDLDDRKRPDLASWFLNRYLEYTGDYTGVGLLRFYLVYRALVRAKVDCIRASQDDVTEPERKEALTEYQSYLDLAGRYIDPPHPSIILMFGLSGSGKTHVSDALLQSLPAIRLRSDIERKRLFGHQPLEHTGSAVDSGIYARSATRQTYQHLQQLAASLVQSGFQVIIDAAFLHAWQRQLFFEVANNQAVPLVIVECTASEKVLRERLTSRAQLGRDASEADQQVLDRQLSSREPLTENEHKHRLGVDTENRMDIEEITASIRRLTARVTRSHKAV